MKIIASVFVFVLAFALHAQNRIGIVIDNTGIPIDQAMIRSSNGDCHEHTTSLGYFRASLKNGDTLFISKEGFSSEEFVCQNSTDTLRITLQENMQSLNEIRVSGARSSNEQLANLQLGATPVRNSQEALTLVPGLFVAQHAGGGKAEQLFLRGFDLDHGTDLQVDVNGTPVNAVSHAHGQGYTDLHFAIPGLIEEVSFDKGPYRLDKGNFNTSGWVDFQLKSNLDQNFISTDVGSFNSLGFSGATQVLFSEKQSAYIAGSWNATDGYFEANQNFQRANVYGSYQGKINESLIIKANGTYFKSQWDASGQIPNRLVRNGAISRFGAVDAAEGGFVNRTGGQFQLKKYFNNQSTLNINSYAYKSGFELYSNFTFFLMDSINGDQIRQKETRLTSGTKIDFERRWKTSFGKIQLISGAGFRNDQIKESELSHTKNRTETLERIQFGNINETNYFGYLGGRFERNKWKLYSGLRLERVDQQYEDLLDPNYQQLNRSQIALLPKIQIDFKASKNVRLFAKSGMGVHSNDARSMLNDDFSTVLPRAYSADLGGELKPSQSLILSGSYWFMRSEQELVYVGDAGIVENNGRSVRHGIDAGISWQPTKKILIQSNATYTHARSEEDGSHIPLGAPFTLAASARYQITNRLQATWYLQHLADRPADELWENTADGYILNHLKIAYNHERWILALQVNNIFNVDWNETQFLTESQLKSETESVEEIHFTPGAPINMKVSFSFLF
jgi:outer membrane cobalamin receptor